jgi:hypothetical protein
MDESDDRGSDYERGRSAPPAQLAARLATAPAGYLEGALANPALTPAHVALCLKNPAVGAAHIRRVAKNRDWLTAYEVRAAIVLHPRAPRALAMNLVALLWWRDLARVSDRTILAPPLRRAAERLLSIRLLEMALGERVTLARMAPRAVIAALRRDDSPMVIRALLQNPRLTEEDVLAITAAPRTSGGVLRAVAEEQRWSCRPAIQKSIARHPQAPRPVALRFVQLLSAVALAELAAYPKLPALVRVAVERRLEARARKGGDDTGAGRR